MNNSKEYKLKQSKNHKFSNELKKYPTKSEVIFKSKLDNLGIKYIFQKGFIKGKMSCIVDFYLPKPYKLVIEIDGGYHLTEAQKAKDKWRDLYLKCERKMKILRLTNEVAESITLEELNNLIKIN